MLLTAPELEDIPADRFDQAIGDVVTQLSAAAFPNPARYELVVRLLVAHVVTLRNKGGAPGALQSESVGGIMSKVYGIQMIDRDVLKLTSYGQQAWPLIRAAGGGPAVT